MHFRVKNAAKNAFLRHIKKKEKEYSNEKKTHLATVSFKNGYLYSF